MTTTSVNPPVENRHSLLLRKIRVVGARTRSYPLQRVLFVAGCVAVPLGLLFMVLGWIGVARTVLVFDQLPYLASGGLIGLALVVLGAFLYFTHWQVMAVEEARQQRDLLAQHHGELVDRLDQLTTALLTRSAEPSVATAAVPQEPLVVTDNGALVHRRDCPIVRDRGARLVSAAEAGRYGPCRICDPVTG